MLALAAQALALVATLVLLDLLPGWALLSTHGLLGAAIGAALGLPAWWLPLNFLFAPLAVWVSGLGVAPLWFFGAFVALGLLFWTTYRTRVPLFISSTEACRALRALLPVHVAPRVIDLGCGLGDVIARLAPARFDASFVGYEVAPLPALVAWLRNRHHANARIARRDFWAENLGTYDVVYAFLSPAAMPELWRKARAEMKPGTLLISNSFPVPGVEPDRIVPLAGRGSNALYLYRL
jgi:SAM-dependent methyltransferase